MDDPQRILIIRSSAIGDVITSAAIIPGLKNVFPGVRIDWVVEPMVVPLLRAHPQIDRLIVWPKSAWRAWRKSGEWGKLVTDMRRFRSDLRAEKYDWVIDLQSLARTRIMARLARAHRRIGFCSREPLGFLMDALYNTDSTNETPGMDEDFIQLFQQLGLSPDGIRNVLYLSQSDQDEARDVIARAGISGDYFVFAPFTTRPQKHWFEDQWCALYARIVARYQCPVVWLGGPGDRDTAARMVAACGGVNLVGQTALGVSCAVIAQSRGLIGVDTGLTHVGSCFSVPTLALFGATRPYLTNPRTPKTIVLYHSRACSPCRRRPTCSGRFDCMRDITVDEILNAGEAIFG